MAMYRKNSNTSGNLSKVHPAMSGDEEEGVALHADENANADVVVMDKAVQKTTLYVKEFLRTSGKYLFFFGAIVSMIFLEAKQPLQLYEFQGLWSKSIAPYLDSSFASQTDFWNFMNNVVATTLLSRDSSIYGNTWSRGNVLLENRIRIRQVRIAPMDCPSSNVAVAGVSPLCFPAWGSGKEAVTFSQNATTTTTTASTTTIDTSSAFTWVSSSGDPSFSTNYNVYPSSGFIVDVANTTSASPMFAALQSSNWIDLATRAVIVSFVFYQPTTSIFVSSVCVFEFLPSGLVRPWTRIYSFPADLYHLTSISEFAALALQLLVIAMALYYAGTLGRRLLTEGLESYKGRGLWIVLEVSQISVIFACFVMRLVIYLKSKTTVQSLLVLSGDMISLSYWHEQLANVTAVFAMLSFVRLLEFFKGITPFVRVVAAIEAAAHNFALALALFFMVATGYATMGTVFLGRSHPSFATLTDSFGSLLAALVGDMDWSSLMKASPMLAGPFIFTWILVCGVGMLSVCAATGIHAYQVMNANGTMSTMGFGGGDAGDEEHKARVDQLRKSRIAVANLTQKLSDVKNADIDGDGVVDKGELEAVLRSSGIDRSRVQELFEKFDKDKSGGLDPEEIKAMQAHLLRQQSTLGKQLDAAHKQSEMEELRRTQMMRGPAALFGAGSMMGKSAFFGANTNFGASMMTLSPTGMMHGGGGGSAGGASGGALTPRRGQLPHGMSIDPDPVGNAVPGAVARQVDRVERQLQKLTQSVSSLGEQMEEVLTSNKNILHTTKQARGGFVTGGQGTNQSVGGGSKVPGSVSSPKSSPRAASPLADTPQSRKVKKALKFNSPKLVVE